MKIAVVGCSHGQLETIYDTIEYAENKCSIKVDLVLCCGDFQATRNLNDLECMAAPRKYREMCSFYKYYSGEKVAPKLTVFVGGNHEASNHLQELPYGGWVAPNIYYLGYAGIVNIGGIRIGGLSGIFNGGDFCKGRYEKPPYHQDSLRSCYHYRNLDIFRLKLVSKPVDIMLSHDWPAQIYTHGNLQQLLKSKPYFKEDIDNDSLGSEPAKELLHHMKPDFWFAAHMHTKFAAVVEHDDSNKKITKFLALDKCLPRRKFMQIIDIPSKSEDMELMYDLEWLAILQLTNQLLSVKKINCYMPSFNEERWSYTPKAADMEMVKKKFSDSLKVPNNFVANVPVYCPNSCDEIQRRVQPVINSQTVEFCQKLGVDDPISLIMNNEKFNTSNSSLNATLNTTFESSSFIGRTDSELESSTSSFHGTSPMISVGSRRTPLKLPEPGNTADLSTDSCLTSTPYKADEVASKNVPFEMGDDEKVDTSSTADNSSEVSGKPRFKRRNLAMYASNDCDI